MSLFGRLHPLLVHFPIALVLMAGAAEIAAAVTRSDRWRLVSVANVRVGAVMAIGTVVAGWELASSSFADVTTLLVWHRAAGLAAAVAAIGAALAAGPRVDQAGRAPYRALLLTAVVLMTIAAHLGASLVWGPAFLWH